MSDSNFPKGWDEDRVRRVLQHYEEQSAEEAVAEDEAAYEPPTHTDKCVRCGGALEAGFAAVVLDGTATPVFWIAGSLERENLTRGAQRTDREQLPVRALRCELCGTIEWKAV
jgi:hypothetical protein